MNCATQASARMIPSWFLWVRIAPTTSPAPSAALGWGEVLMGPP